MGHGGRGWVVERCLVFGDALVEVEEGGGEGGPGFGEGGSVVELGLVEIGEDSEFGGGGGAGEGEAEGVGDLVGQGGVGFFGEDAGGEGLGGFDVDGVVEEGEGLEGGVAAGAFDDAGHAGGGVEVDEAGVGGAAFEDDVEAAAVFFLADGDGVVVLLAADFFPEAVGLRRIDGGAAFFGAEEAGDGEGVVADGFGVEAEAGAAGVEVVGVVFFDEFGGEGGVLAEGGGGGDEAEEFFHGPAVFHEGDGEVVEQFGMGGRGAFDAEVFDGGDEAVAEEFGPPAVDGDAGGEGVFFGNEPLGEAEAVGGAGGFGEDGGGGGGDGGGGVGVDAALEDGGHAGLGELLHDFGGGGFEGGEFFVDAGHLFFHGGEAGHFEVEVFAELGELAGVVFRALEEGGDGGGEGGGGEAAGEGGEADTAEGAGAAVGLGEGDDEFLGGGEAEGGFEFEGGVVRFGEFGVDGPGGFGVVVDGAGGVEVLLGEVGGGGGEFEGLAVVVIGVGEAGAGFEGVEDEVGAVGGAAAGSGAGEVGVGEGFELEAGDVFEGGGFEDEAVGVGVGGFAGEEDGAVFEFAVGGAVFGDEFDDVEGVLGDGFGRGGAGFFEPGLEGGVGVFLEGGHAGFDGGFFGLEFLAGGVGGGAGHFEGAAVEGDGAGDFGVGAFGFFLGVVEVGEEAVVVGLGDGVVFVVVALGALEGGAEPDGAGGVDAVEDLIDAAFLGFGAGFDVGGGAAMEASGDDLIDGGVGEEVAGDLLDGEAVEGHVGVEGVDDPVAEAPDFAEVVALEAVGVGVAGEVEPRAGPADAEFGGVEELVDEGFDGGLGVFGGGGFEGGDLGGGGREAGEGEVEAAGEGGRVGGFGGGEVFGFEAGEDEAVEVVFGPGGVFDRGR